MEPIQGTSASNKKHSIPIDILDDLCSRFIINLPAEDRGNLVRICFQMELAHWFYLDYYCTDESKRLHTCGIREFAAHIFQHVPTLREHMPSLDSVLEHWRQYKLQVPTYGAVLLDERLTHVLLVQSYWARSSWGFPKGKVNEDEEPWKCAVREVLEETGCDISQSINKHDYIEAVTHDQLVRLYIIGHVPRSTEFKPQTRNEIKACEWFPLADLPSSKKDMTPKLKMGVSPNAFFMVLPFVKRIRRWAAEHQSKTFTNSGKRTRHKSMGDIESSSKNRSKSISQVLENEIQDYQNSSALTAKAAFSGQKQVSCPKAAGSAKKDKKHSKRQLFTPQNTQDSASPEHPNPKTPEVTAGPLDQVGNFFPPAWKNFQLDIQAILDCLY